MSLATSQKHLNVESAVSMSADRKKKVGCAAAYLFLGFISIVLSILSIHYNFLDLALNERIKLRPGLPPFEKWRNPSNVDLAVRTYIFAVENPHEFLHNKNVKLKLKEIGPIYYKKTMRQEDIVFHEEDSTMSYTTVHQEEYIDEMNEPFILNKTITIINPILLGIGAMTRSNIWAKYPYEWAAKKDSVFINRTVYEVLWNTTSPILEFIKQIPFVVRRPNAGILFNSFFPSLARYNVNIGPKHGFENFFKINTLNGMSQIDVYSENFPKHCPYSLKGASEGTGLPPRLSKDTVIKAYTKNLCRTYPMVYNRTVKTCLFDTYEYVFSSEIYKRSPDPDTDCQRKTLEVVLPDGLIDASKCALGMPMALSNPHFWGYHGKWETQLDGINPQLDKHSSYMRVEPISGIQLDATARIQSNIPMPTLEGYPEDVKRFSEMILPLFWMEYTLHNGDPLIHGMIFFVINLPVIQPIVVLLLLILSAFAIYKAAVLGLGFNLSRTWKPTKSPTSTYPTTTERYFSNYPDDIEKTAL